MELFLDRGDDRSLSRQLYDQLRDAIGDGRLPPGGRLQPTRVVAEELGVARSTVTEAYGRLTAEGYIEGRRGGGSVVQANAAAHAPPAPARTALTPTPEASAVRRYSTDFAADARYDLTPGRVDARLFPLVEWRRCANRALGELAGQLGHYTNPIGSSELRRAVTQWLTRSRGIAATPDQIVITHGAGNAVDVLARVLLRPGDVAAVEEPGYPPVTNLLRSQGIEVVGVPVDEDGLVVDALPDAARLVYVTPSHQYPLGMALRRDRRLALLRWASRCGAAVVEDDYDSEFRHSSSPMEPLHRLDRDGRVIYVGTFSKILSPVVRIGFAVVPPGLVEAVTAVRQAVDFGPSPLVTVALTDFVDRGHLDRHLRRARRVYATRHRAIMSALTTLAGSEVTPLPSQAGLHVAVLAEAAAHVRVFERASHRGLRLSSLGSTYQFGEPHAGIVLGFGAIATAAVPDAIELLGSCLA